MKFSFIISFFIHITTMGIIYYIPQIKNKSEPDIIVTPISQKQFDKIVQTARDKKQIKTNNKKYLSDKTNDTDKNQIARGSPGSNNKSTSTLQKGKYTPNNKKGSGLSAGDDYIEGAVIGPMTILNTQEFKYYNYYERLKERIQTIWRPLIREVIYKLDINKQLKVGIFTTKLLVDLNKIGEIIKIQIIAQSGYEEFDKIGTRAFLQAEPFPGPPKELINDNVFQLRWDFIVNVQESGIIEYKGGHVK